MKIFFMVLSLSDSPNWYSFHQEYFVYSLQDRIKCNTVILQFFV